MIRLKKALSKPAETLVVCLLCLNLFALIIFRTPESFPATERQGNPGAAATAVDAADIAQAALVRQQWIVNETVTFVLQQDMNATFFFVEDNAEGGIDPVRGFLLQHESHVRRLFNHLLYAPSCELDAPFVADWGVGCALKMPTSPFSSSATSNKGKCGIKKTPLVLDVGSNRGYYAMLSAAYGYTVHAFDPQPHCASLLSATILMNGFSDRLHFHHAFVSNTRAGSSSSPSSEVMRVRRRTGCTGTFPNDNDSGWGDSFRKPLQALHGADDEVEVRGVRLDDEFSAAAHDVLLMKVDVEGHEFAVLDSARKLISGRAVRNILMELNLPMMKKQEDGLEATKKKTRTLIRWLMHDVGYRAKVNVRGPFDRQAPMIDKEWDSLLWEDDGWNTLDAWFYLPRES